MRRYVVDNSVAVKWFVPEVHSDAAARLLRPQTELIVPDLLPSEFANVALSMVRSGRITLSEALALLTDFARMPLHIRSSLEFLQDTLLLSIETGASAYDSTYVTLAIREDCPFVTADARLHRLMAPHFRETMLWIEDLPGPEGE